MKAAVKPKKNPQIIQDNLKALLQRAESIPINNATKIIIFSDLHVGNRTARSDDFLHNSELLLCALKNHYLPLGYTLILNGDIEELQKFTLSEIKKSWPDFYSVLEYFDEKKQLIKIYGNHDEKLTSTAINTFDLYESIKLLYKEKELLIFHGHQASKYYANYNDVAGFFLRFFANPLGIKNISPAQNSAKQFKVEKRVYEFSRKAGLLSIIGHTHRPLFESMSKYDTLKFEIEEMIKNYPNLSISDQKKVSKEIKRKKVELEDTRKKERKKTLMSGLYSQSILVPCLFNSGCCIGKRGITGLEISEGKIRLITWFSTGSKGQEAQYTEFLKVSQNGHVCEMAVIKEDLLDNIFTRIELLA